MNYLLSEKFHAFAAIAMKVFLVKSTSGTYWPHVGKRIHKSNLTAPFFSL